MPPAWVQISRDVTHGIEEIKVRMSKLQQVHSRAILTTFDDAAGTEQEVEVMTQEITRVFKKCEKALVALAQTQGSEGDAKVRQNVQRQLASELQALSMDFRKGQKEYLQKVRDKEGSGGMSGGECRPTPSPLALAASGRPFRLGRVSRCHPPTPPCRHTGHYRQGAGDGPHRGRPGPRIHRRADAAGPRGRRRPLQ